MLSQYDTQTQDNFTVLFVSARQVQYIRVKHHVHLLSTGRINMSGLSSKNIDRVAEAIYDTVTKIHN
jgi:aspartate/tyrosine/aromatic aminotransferase